MPEFDINAMIYGNLCQRLCKLRYILDNIIKRICVQPRHRTDCRQAVESKDTRCMEWFTKSHEYRVLDCIDGEPVEFEMDRFPRTHNTAAAARDPNDDGGKLKST